MSKTKYIWASIAILLILIIPLLLHAYLGSFSRLLGDDYCSAYQANRLGALRATWFWYLTWSGRYSASLLDSIFGILGPSTIPFATPAVIIIWFITLGIFFNIFFNQSKYNLLFASILSTSILFLTLNFTPYIQQSLYWGQGMRAVVPPLILGTGYAGLFNALKNKKQSAGYTRYIWYILSIVIVFGMGGFSETYCVIQLIALGISIASLLFTKRYKLYSFEMVFLLSGFLGAVLSLFVILAAPGNEFRQIYFPPPPDFFKIIAISLNSSIAFITEMFSTAESITGFLGVLLLSIIIGYKTKFRKENWSKLSLITVSGVLLIFSSFPPAAYAMSEAPPGRTLILSTYILGTLIIFIGINIGNHIPKKNNHVTSLYFHYISMMFITVLLATSSFIVTQKMHASRHLYSEFAEEWDKSHETLLSLGSDINDVVTPAVKDAWSGVLKMRDNPRFYVNVCVSNYYGFKSIIATDDIQPTLP